MLGALDTQVADAGVPESQPVAPVDDGGASASRDAGTVHEADAEAEAGAEA